MVRVIMLSRRSRCRRLLRMQRIELIKFRIYHEKVPTDSHLQFLLYLAVFAYSFRVTMQPVASCY